MQNGKEGCSLAHQQRQDRTEVPPEKGDQSERSKSTIALFDASRRSERKPTDVDMIAEGYFEQVAKSGKPLQGILAKRPRNDSERRKIRFLT